MYELSFTPTFYNEMMNLPKQTSRHMSRKLHVLMTDPFSAQGDARKLKCYTNVYRVRIGDYRLFYSIGTNWVKLLSVRKRDEDTYEHDVPDFLPPVAPPDPERLSPQLEPVASSPILPQQQQAVSMPHMHVHETPTAQDTSPSTPLPYPLTPTLLNQWRIPETYHATILAIQTVDEVLDIPIPEHYSIRILDNLLPRSLNDISTQPDYVLRTPEQLETLTDTEITTFLQRLDSDQLLEYFLTQPTVSEEHDQLLEYFLAQPTISEESESSVDNPTNNITDDVLLANLLAKPLQPVVK